MRTKQLTKCFELLQKLKARLGTHPPVILNYRPCQGGTSDVVLCVPRFGVSVYTVSPFVCLDDIYLSLGSRVATVWERAAQSINPVFS